MKTGQRRMIHLSIWSSVQVSRLSIPARVTYIGLIVLGDDDGRLKADPRLIKSQIFPYDEDVKVSDVRKWMGEIIDQKLVMEYDVDGVSYIMHPKWEDHQLLRDDRRKESNIPAPMLEFFPMTTKRQPTDNHTVDKSPRKLSKDKLREGNTDTSGSDAAFASFWEKYPKKVGRKAAWKAWEKVQYTSELGSKIMDGLAAAIASDQWTKDSGRYVPHAATWLNGERWEDDMRPSKVRNTKYDKIGTKVQA